MALLSLALVSHCRRKRQQDVTVSLVEKETMAHTGSKTAGTGGKPALAAEIVLAGRIAAAVAAAGTI
jgi:hypothetical protein